jgi:CMP-N-acetylneuraminic acid synthetase
VEILAASDADSVVSVLPVPHEYNPRWVYWIDDAGHLELATGGPEPIGRRQDLHAACHRDGSIYLTRRDTVIDGSSLYGSNVIGYSVDPLFSVNIDGEQDWGRAEEKLRNRSAARGQAQS